MKLCQGGKTGEDAWNEVIVRVPAKPRLMLSMLPSSNTFNKISGQVRSKESTIPQPRCLQQMIPHKQSKNYYSKFVHEIEHEGRGYAFAYDDVTLKGEWDQSGLVASPQPRLLRIIVGGT